jgi:hypothetical protein
MKGREGGDIHSRRSTSMVVGELMTMCESWLACT